MKKPLVSVLLICYNHENFVEQAIKSVIDQTYTNTELIVVDDYSTDNSRAVISQINKKYQFTFVENDKNEGLNYSIVKALNKSSGTFISILASDDYMHVKKTEVELDFLLKNHCDGVYATGYSILNNNKVLIKIDSAFKNNDKKKALEFLYTQDWGVPLLQSALLKAHVMKELIPLREQYKSDDWAFIIRAYENYDILYINEPLFFYRLHENNTHKNYWFTYPMRIEIASRLIPAQFRKKSIANINLSQGNYLLADKHFFFAISFYVNSLILHFTFKNLISIIKNFAVYFRNFFKRKANSQNPMNI